MPVQVLIYGGRLKITDQINVKENPIRKQNLLFLQLVVLLCLCKLMMLRISVDTSSESELFSDTDCHDLTQESTSNFDLLDFWDNWLAC